MKAYALTDVGKVRSINQDSVFCTDKPVGNLPNLYIVADGMGGHKAGDTASRYTIETFVDRIRNSESDNPITMISDAIKYTNSRLIEMAQSSEDLSGMGTTFVMATIFDKSVYIANIGDSRLYILGDELRQVTRDHSLVEEMVSSGTINREEARHHSHKNIITRAVGGSNDVQADFFEIELSEGNILFMCSDGLSNMVSDKDIENILRENTGIDSRAAMLIDAANSNGGNDNISVIIIEP